ATQRVGISFTISRNGAVSNVNVSHPSGSYDLDISARRAVADANPLPPLPREFNKSEATVELWFQLK
ncbi:MAG TPA: energy transducer TonB, partial [Bryobacteraceae bacterium]